jgi:UDP-N-acetylglucosamine transferase subunit ALG13
MPVLAAGTPIVLVPRQHSFGEHVDDHQVAFCTRVADRRAGVHLVTDIATLGDRIRAALVDSSVAHFEPAQPRVAVEELRRRVLNLTNAPR